MAEAASLRCVARIRTLERAPFVPPLVEPEWRLASSIDSVRHRVFVGRAAGMPTWGIAGTGPREIDTAAFYVLDLPRPGALSH